MFALRQIDREPVVRPLQMKSVFELGNPSPSPHSPSPFFFPSLPLPSPSLVRSWLPQPTHLHTPSFLAHQRLPCLPFPDWAGLVPRSQCRLPSVPTSFQVGERWQPRKWPSMENKSYQLGDPQNNSWHRSKPRVTYRKHAHGG